MSENKIHELAEVDYVKGMKYSDIADKYDVSINTVKSWKQRHKWQRSKTAKSMQPKKKVLRTKKVQPNGMPTDDERSRIEDNLMNQLKSNGTYQPTYIDLVKDYMKFWDIKNQLIADIEGRGVQVRTYNSNGDIVYKKNDSIVELPKYNAQMNKLLNELGLNALSIDSGDDDEI